MIKLCSASCFLAFSECLAFDKKSAMDSFGLVQVGTSGIEFFQILLDGCWLAAVYPNSHEDSNVTWSPFHSLPSFVALLVYIC
jgi:hypothetical protein